MEITEADERHIPAIQQIYAYHVLHGTATFETEPPDAVEMAIRLKKVLAAGLPWFVVVDEGQVRGYCYLSFYRERFAYRFTLEDSIYIDPTFQGRGIGKRLLSRAVMWAEARGFRQLVAVVGNSENTASLALHRAAGFSITGTLTSVGFKHGRWLDTVILQRTLGQGDTTLPEYND
ncbi:putative acetyltransferase [Pectobacterium atrosepticum SCRI1043]|uniref:Acetyltransferase n=1 Tax=Pectobacterium atrosepticum (strain SCRI 1043 / ATCC BAA-672) TaxID=218491 RepID=Q6D8L6_PECAS|nr:GNAT family N-acetyltransferase [Pectobacterium atrosepticum]GKV86131.1 phosphinothricin N-acetyltransferase [Pectobacterium carotovorum subsp. carotovorum]AIA69847.1 phosphinothricin acetyltransferase [Pectobacterium atrosepticum]AIK12759.1 putative acetyltransferase [Pectobacterium atrosepticum]ATY89764.1 N-acetyltransferase [Pectobacterium atrosepticum]KFX11923.1 phosphinothricin acetyltransferase [Pectobacterium atrosepticum]